MQKVEKFYAYRKSHRIVCRPDILPRLSTSNISMRSDANGTLRISWDRTRLVVITYIVGLRYDV